MANRSKADREIYIIAAATLFVTVTRDAQEIANLLNSSKRSIHHWAKTQRWSEVLRTLGYEGENNFRTQPARNTQENPNFSIVETAYREACEQGVPKHKRASTVSAETGVKYWTIWSWAKKHSWDD